MYWQRKENAAKGYVTFPDGEVPPPSALAGRRVIGAAPEVEKPKGRIGKTLFGALFGKVMEAEPLPPSKVDEEKGQVRKSRLVSYRSFGVDGARG